MLGIINYTKLFLWSSIYYFQKEKSKTIFKIIVKNIKESGCVTIKLVQWVLPKIEAIYNIDKSNPRHSWFYDLEEVYENCHYHDIKHTEDIYKKDFSRDITQDYDIIEEVASGSIGQVYKIKSKYDNREYAMKVLHPNVNSNLYLMEYLLKFMYSVPILTKFSRYYFPIRISDFISDFRTQTNMINEGNNLLHFIDVYKDQDVFIIPKVYKFSKNILIMSYEEGTTFDKIDASDYMKYKMIILNKIFVKNNQHTHGLMHGDLHKGNWKIRIDEDNNIKIVIYDYGFCWRMPDFILQEESMFIDRAMITPIENIDNYVKAMYILINKMSPIESILESVSTVKNNMIKEGKGKNELYDDPLFLLNLILEDSRKNDFLIDSFIFQSVIVHNQLCNNLIKYGINVKEGKSDYFKNQILTIINICKTYKTCMGYSHILEKEYEELNIKKDTLFESTDYLKGYNLDIN
jgi:hypothetical protein